MSKVWLVSALVQKPDSFGHRAQLLITDSQDEALGAALRSFQVDGWSVSSHDIVLCDSVIPKQEKDE